ncbi:hypothetical protein EBZ39_15400 [bacterium]|nr:hypothetical protein [bacterium]
MSDKKQEAMWTPRKLAKLAGGYGNAYADILSDDLCIRLAYARIAMWLSEQEEASLGTLDKARAAMDILSEEWNQEADLPTREEYE